MFIRKLILVSLLAVTPNFATAQKDISLNYERTIEYISQAISSSTIWSKEGLDIYPWINSIHRAYLLGPGAEDPGGILTLRLLHADQYNDNSLPSDGELRSDISFLPDKISKITVVFPHPDEGKIWNLTPDRAKQFAQEKNLEPIYLRLWFVEGYRYKIHGYFTSTEHTFDSIRGPSLYSRPLQLLNRSRSEDIFRCANALQHLVDLIREKQSQDPFR
ncbi:MAG: hypothetical protein AAFX76_01470 [Planctomycetota bacterium]